MNKKFNFEFPKASLPIQSLRDLLNIIKQDIKFKFIPFRLYYKYRAHKYSKNTSPELNIIHSISDSNKVSLDIGANLGLFTYFMSRSSKKVFAFEPNPYPLKHLKNIIDNNVEIVPIAIGDEDGVIKLNVPKNRKGWSSNGASIKNVKLNRGMQYEVSIRKIDTLKIHNIGLIKIDVEGAELEVLKGARKTISDQKPNLIIENEINHTHTPELLFNFMKNINYNAFYVNNNKKLVKLEGDFNIFENQKDPANKRFGYIQNFIFIHQDNIRI